jgi:hypothetical protein
MSCFLAVGLHEAVFDRKVVGNSCIPRVGILLHELFLIEKSLEIAASRGWGLLYELFLIEKSLEIAASRGWGLLYELFLIWAAYCWAA